MPKQSYRKTHTLEIAPGGGIGTTDHSSTRCLDYMICFVPDLSFPEQQEIKSGIIDHFRDNGITLMPKRRSPQGWSTPTPTNAKKTFQNKGTVVRFELSESLLNTSKDQFYALAHIMHETYARRPDSFFWDKCVPGSLPKR